MYRWEPHKLTLLYSGNVGTFLSQSAYHCEQNEIINAVDRSRRSQQWSLVRVRNDGTETKVLIPEGPARFEQYQGRLLVDTEQIKLVNNETSSLREFVQHGVQTYNDIVDYNLTTGKVETRYPYGGVEDFMFRVGKNLYVATLWLIRIDLDTGKKTDIYTPILETGRFYPSWAVTSDERAFILYNPYPCGSHPLPPCSAVPKLPFKDDIIYEITTGVAVEALTVNYPDAITILGVEKDIYIFTNSSERVVRYNTENKTVTEYRFPFRNLTNINYLDKSFVVCYYQPADGGRYCLVTDDTFENSTKPINLTVTAISTAYRRSGGRDIVK